MRKISLFVFFITIELVSLGQDDIDYQNKHLVSSLKKNGIYDISLLEETKSYSFIQTETKGKFFTVSENLKTSEVKYVYVGRVNSCRTGGCSNSGSSIPENRESEYFDYFIFFDLAKTVKLVEVYNYAATHGYEITSKGWLKQFAGFSGNDTLLVNKDIDGITGATVSVYAITADIQEKVKILGQIK